MLVIYSRSTTPAAKIYEEMERHSKENTSDEEWIAEYLDEFHIDMQNIVNPDPVDGNDAAMGLFSPFCGDLYMVKPTALPFCHCRRMMPGTADNDDRVVRFCPCGEWRRPQLDWSWDASSAAADKVRLSGNQGSRVQFHPEFARGTALLRADRPLLAGSLNYFEIHVESPTLGTDTMIGVGTVDGAAAPDELGYYSLIGHDRNSWGYSCNGYTQFDGSKCSYSSLAFGKGCLLGCAVDLHRGTIEFYLNRRPLGVAYGGLPRNVPLYAYASSTCFDTVLKLTHTSSHPVNLQLLCMERLARSETAMRSVRSVPGLRAHCERLFYLHCKERYVTPLESQMTAAKLSQPRPRPAWEYQARWQHWLAEKRRRGSWYLEATQRAEESVEAGDADGADGAEGADGADEDDDVERQLYGDIADDGAEEAPVLTRSSASQTCYCHRRTVPPDDQSK